MQNKRNMSPKKVDIPVQDPIVEVVILKRLLLDIQKKWQ